MMPLVRLCACQSQENTAPGSPRKAAGHRHVAQSLRLECSRQIMFNGMWRVQLYIEEQGLGKHLLIGSNKA